MANELAQAMHDAFWIETLGESAPANIWDKLPADGAPRRGWGVAAQAVHDFLGVEKGKELGRNAVATMVEGIRWGIERCDAKPDQQTCVGCDALPENAVDDAGVCPLQAALRAAGEEVT